MHVQTVTPVKVETQGRKGKKITWKKQQQKCVEELDTFFKTRSYLPAKDITHLLVFQSRKVLHTHSLRRTYTHALTKTHVRVCVHTHAHLASSSSRPLMIPQSTSKHFWFFVKTRSESDCLKCYRTTNRRLFCWSLMHGTWPLMYGGQVAFPYWHTHNNDVLYANTCVHIPM